MAMLSCLDHVETVALWKEKIHGIKTKAHSTTKMRLQNPQDFFIPPKGIVYERIETGITTK